MDLSENKNFYIFLGFMVLVTFFAGKIIDRRIKNELDAFELPSYDEAFDERVKTWKIIYRSFIVNNKYGFSMSLSPIDGARDDGLYLGHGDHFWKMKNTDTMYISRSLDTLVYVFDIEELK